MKALRFALLPGFLMGLAGPAAAEKLSLDQISTYFNGFKTAEAGFTQFNSDGSRSTGRFYLQRPGRARFEYDPPNDALVMAGGGTVAVFDNKSNQPPSEYPLKRTPLNLILKRSVNLKAENMVVAHQEYQGETVIVAQDPEHPEYGSIRLHFSPEPMALTKWVIVDDVGGETTVALEKFETGVKISSFKFNIPFEIENRLGSN